MFVYQLPPGTADVLVTNRVIFTVIRRENSGEVSYINFDTNNAFA